MKVSRSGYTTELSKSERTESSRHPISEVPIGNLTIAPPIHAREDTTKHRTDIAKFATQPEEPEDLIDIQIPALARSTQLPSTNLSSERFWLSTTYILDLRIAQTRSEQQVSNHLIGQVTIRWHAKHGIILVSQYIFIRGSLLFDVLSVHGLL